MDKMFVFVLIMCKILVRKQIKRVALFVFFKERCKMSVRFGYTSPDDINCGQGQAFLLGPKMVLKHRHCSADSPEEIFLL